MKSKHVGTTFTRHHAQASSTTFHNDLLNKLSTQQQNHGLLDPFGKICWARYTIEITPDVIYK